MMPSDSAAFSRKEQILEQAKTLFHLQGFSATSMRELATAVGVEAPTIYNHFKNKEGLLWAICKGKISYFKENMLQLQSISEPESAVRNLIQTHIKIALQDPRGHSIFLQDWKFLEGEHKELYLKERNAYEKDAISLIQSGINKGTFQHGDATVIFYTFINAIRWLYRYDWDHGSLHRDITSVQIEDMLIRSILA
jgi:AcrR family transcriptional regulator